MKKDKGRVLFVEDEEDLCMIVADTLRGEGYEVVTARDGLEGYDRFCADGADIVVADVMMPGMSGFEMVRKIRRLSPLVPVLFLTAKSTMKDMERGFDIGGDDYLRKPFEFRELVLRIGALLRRLDRVEGAASEVVGMPAEHAEAGDSPVYEIGSCVFDIAAQTVCAGSRIHELSYFEARLLECLALEMGHTIEASRLMIAVWGRDDVSNRNSLHVYIHKLRRILSADASVAILNQRGYGYMLTVRR